MSKVAVLIPTYKPEGYIVRCLQSLDEQSLDKSLFKVYLALNGSEPSHAEYLISVLSSVSFQHELFVLDKAGVSLARNFLIDNSIEDYIVFIDDDDFVSENYLNGLLNVADVDCMAVSNIRTYCPVSEDFKYSYRDDLYHTFCDNEKRHWKSRRYFSSVLAKMLHRTAICSVRQDVKLRIGEDSLFLAEISRNIKSVRKTQLSDFYAHNERPGSTTRTKQDRTEEIKRITYLLGRYSLLLLKPRYQRFFILTRIVATFRHLKRLL